MLKLYDYAQCPFCQRVRIALAEKGLPYERVPVDLDRGEEQTPNFKRLNPLSRVPVLVDGKNTVTESNVINEYLEERFSKKPLFPKDAGKRAEIRTWIHYSDDYLMDTMAKMFHQKELPPEVKREIRDHLLYLNKTLKGKKYLAGSLSLADISFYPLIKRLPEWGISLKPYNNVDRWLARLSERPAFQETHGK